MVQSVQIPSYQAGMDVRFAAATRHSRLVRLLRIAVPAAVLLSLAVIIGISVFNPFRILTKLPLDFGNMVVSGTKITMETPHLAGFAPDGRPYEVWAKTATQDLTKPDSVDLAVLRAKVQMEDKSTVTMDARRGLFNTKIQILDLQEDIFLQSSTGYEAKLTRAIIDIAGGSIVSEEPVDVKLLNGTLNGKKLKISEHGDLVRFDGGVVMNLTMEPPVPQPTEAESESEPALAPAAPAQVAPLPPSRTERRPADKRANAK